MGAGFRLVLGFMSWSELDGTMSGARSKAPNGNSAVKWRKGMNTDPRRGLPSASAMDRLEACPASFHASKRLPDSSSEDAESGTRIHKALGTGDTSELSPDELDTFEMCLDQRQQIVEARYGFRPWTRCPLIRFRSPSWL